MRTVGNGSPFFIKENFMEEQKEKRLSFTAAASYAAEFALCGFVGWLYEITVMYVMYRQYEPRGFLQHLPILPIYGFFGLILLFVFRKRNNAVFVFLVSMAVTTAGELAASYIIEALLGRQLWTYHMWKFNFQGRIALYSSLMFGGLSLLLVKAVHPLMRLFHKKLPKVCAVLGCVSAAAIAADFVYSLVSSKL